MEIYLVRHAIKEKTIGDVPITKEGVKQAQLIVQYFKNIPIFYILKPAKASTGNMITWRIRSKRMFLINIIPNLLLNKVT